MLHADASSAPHPAPVIYAALPGYEAIVEAINRRRGQVNVSVKTLALAASLQPGFVGAALGPSRTRRLGYLSLPLLLAPLGLRLGLIEAPELAARYTNEMEKANSNQARSNNDAAIISKRVKDRVLRHLMANARKQRWHKTSKKKRSEHARKMALARWRLARRNIRATAPANIRHGEAGA
jgi:hypothetical protein